MNISENEQDIALQVILKQDTAVQKQLILSDTSAIRDTLPPKKAEKKLTVVVPEITDTVSVSVRNYAADITFYDSANFITRIKRDSGKEFPYNFIQKNLIRVAESRSFLMTRLKDGENLPARSFHEDWIIIIILAAAFLYASIRTFSGKLFPGVIRFFLFRGIGDPSARETSELFHWQSTILNLITFFNLALFGYCCAFYYDLVPDEFSGILSWLILFGVIVAAVTLRHIVCMIAGNLSVEKEVFDEYIVTIYQSYRFLALVCFVLVILLSYTFIFPPKALFFTGFILTALFYLMRISRLLMIFLKRNISILYLILYLCALEFLPVVVLVKYITGLF